MSSQSAPSAPTAGANAAELRYQWLKELKEKNAKEPGSEHWVMNADALTYAHHWRDKELVAMRRGPQHPTDPMNWLVRIVAKGVEFVEEAEARREREKA